nr:reverse transcriptase domain-containing protein [Tanacetum cinerariifolium]
MSTNEQTPLSQPTSVVRNTLGREQALQNLVRPVPDEDLREYCDKNYHKILPIIAEKLHQEKVQQEKLKAVKARLNFEEALQYSESETPNRRRNLKERLGPRGARTRSIIPKQRRDRSKSPKEKGPKRRTVFKILEKVVGGRRKAATKVLVLRKYKLLSRNIITKESTLEERKQSQKAKEVQEGTGSQNQISKSQVWRMTYPNHGKMHQRSGRNLQHQAKKWGIHERVYGRYKLECRDVKGAPECMKIFGFMHRIINPELIKRLHDKIPQSIDEMMSVTTAFLRGEMAASNGEWKKSFTSWKQETRQKQNFKRGNLQNEQRFERKQDRFTLLTKTPREILALDKGKFKPPLPMITLVEKRNASKFCEFHGEVGYTNDECMHLKRHIEEMLKAGKLSHLIKELKQNNEKDQAKTAKKGETSEKDKPLAILMVQPWQRIARQRITQTFSPGSVIFFSALREEDRTEGLMIIEAEMGGHCVHRIYVNGGSSYEILGEIIWPLGQISLLVRIGDEEHSTSTRMNFMVVRSPSPYNGIRERSGVRKIRAIPSMAHGMIKFLVAGGIVTLQSSRIIPLECSMVSEPEV